MTIKEAEARTGMTRANIRFYEAEGLICPQRGENGYRDYSEDDIETLKRIKLLRLLELSLEEIKALQRGERRLGELLESHIPALTLERGRLERSEEVCRAIRGDGAEFATLDAGHYLDRLEHGRDETGQKQTERVLFADVEPVVHAPWRRFFARALDFDLCLLLCCVFGVRGQALGQFLNSVVSTVFAALLMLLAEPLLLRLWGTTPGKFLMGLRLTDPEDRKLSYAAGLRRTLLVLLVGYGAFIPILQQICLIRCLWRSSRDEALTWEDGSVFHEKKFRWWRGAALAAASGLCLAAMVLLGVIGNGTVAHRGDITVAQFCDNYNALIRYNGQEEGNALLDSRGNWVEPEGVIVIGMWDTTLPTLEFDESEGVVTGVRFAYHSENSGHLPSSYTQLMQLLTQALVGAQKGGGAFSEERKALLEQIAASPFEDFTLSACGVTATCRVEYSGFYPAQFGEDPVLLWEEEGAPNEYTITFSLTKTERSAPADFVLRRGAVPFI